MDGLVARMQALEARVSACGKVAVAFSGGVDSTVVACVANKVLGHDALILLARTETIVDEDVALARSLAAQHGFNLMEVEYSELEIDEYAANPVNRCYYCKGALFERLAAIARDRHIDVLFDGSNADDEGDYRPGRQAAHELGVRSPLSELGFTKADVRHAARLLGLPNHDKPAAPCLSSRIPYGTVIDAASLVRIAHAERDIRGRGFVNVRVRHHGTRASIEVDHDAIGRLREVFPDVERRLQELGYLEVVIDDEGFKSGKLNRALPPNAQS
jgi:pyridinium-3,5-biscarboxylic acid mononucleotide sulfurtransferase